MIALLALSVEVEAAFYCTVRFATPACVGDEVPLFRMQDIGNAHAETVSQSNYDYTVCCGGVSPIILGTACAGIYDEVIYLSDDTNAHVANPLVSTFPAPRIVCLSASSGNVDCLIHDSTLTSTDCPTAEYECMASMNESTNSHVGNCSAYDYKVCCMGGGDTDPPVTTLTGTPPSFTNESSPFYAGNSNDSQTDIVDIEYRADGGATIGWTDVNAFPVRTNTTFNFTTFIPLPDGIHTIEVRAQDGAGNWETVYDSHSVTVDATEPNTVLTTTPPPLTNDSTPNYSGTATDAMTDITGIQYRVDGGGWIDVMGFTPALSVGFSFTPSLSQGAHTIEVRSGDLAGNWETTCDSHSLTVDWGKPQSVMNPYAPDPTNDSTVTCTGNAQDAATNVTNVQYRYSFGAGPFGAWTDATPADGAFDEDNEAFSFSLILPSGDGTYTFQTRANDSAGNLETAFPSDTITLDTGEPDATLNPYVPDPETIDYTPTYTGTATDGLSNIAGIQYRYSLGAGPFGAWADASPSDGSFNSLSEGFTFTAPPLADGTYTFETRARDSAGNWETSYGSDTLTIGIGPVITIGHTPTYPDDGAPVNITVTATDASNIQQITIYVDNLWQTCSFPVTAPTRNCHFWSAVPYVAGTTHYYNATATDGLGYTSWSPTYSFSVGKVPVLGFVAPSFELTLLGAVIIVIFLSLLSAWQAVKRG